jgi:hypothetical protein
LFFLATLQSIIQDIAAASLFLSSKLEEHPVRIRDLINCFDYLFRLVDFEAGQLEQERLTGPSALPPPKFDYKPMDYFAKSFYDWKDEIVIGESQILKVSSTSRYFSKLCSGKLITGHVDIATRVQHSRTEPLRKHCKLPASAQFDRSSGDHTASLVICKRLVSFWTRRICLKKIANSQMSWFSLLTPLLATHPPHLISVACVYLAVLVSTPQVVLPMEPAPWFVLFDVASEEDIWQACRVLLEVYTRWTGSTEWLLEPTAGDVAPDLEKPLARRLSIWRRATQLDLPLTKAEVRAIVDEP